MFLTDFKKSSNIKFHENPHSGSHVPLWEQTGMIKLSFFTILQMHLKVCGVARECRRNEAA